jgi:hypothetical protein
VSAQTVPGVAFVDAEEVAGETDSLVADSDGDGTLDGEDARPTGAGTITASTARARRRARTARRPGSVSRSQ